MTTPPAYVYLAKLRNYMSAGGGGDDEVMTDEQLNAIEARANAATAGAWRVGSDGFIDVYKNNGDRLIEDCGTYTTADAVFIAAARSDVPALVVEVKRLRAEIAELHQRMDYLKHCAA